MRSVLDIIINCWSQGSAFRISSLKHGLVLSGKALPSCCFSSLIRIRCASSLQCLKGLNEDARNSLLLASCEAVCVRVCVCFTKSVKERKI